MTFQHRTAPVGARFTKASRRIQATSAPLAEPAAPAEPPGSQAADPEPAWPCFLDTLAPSLVRADTAQPAAAAIDAGAIYGRLNSGPAKAMGKPPAAVTDPAAVYRRFNRAAD